MIIPQLKAERRSITNAKADIVACLVFEDKKFLQRDFAHLRENFPSASITLDVTNFAGKDLEILVLHVKERKRILLVGLGKNEKLTLERLRRAAAVAAKTAKNLQASSLAIIVPDADRLSRLKKGENIGTALAEGAMLSIYKFDKYLTNEKKKSSSLKLVSILTDDSAYFNTLKREVGDASILCNAAFLARDLANAPANEIYPETLAERARTSLRSGIAMSVFDERRIRTLKMGGILAVAKGSDRPPRFIIMEYNKSKRALPCIVLVGKGVTFDAGGISIKPASGMGDMKSDMAGAATVIATMQAISRLRLPVRVVGLVPAAENLLNGKAMKPGDVIVHLNGKTSEVDNTDAEGRLILADALSYASRYKPELVIDLATLTGHVVVGLGHHATGMMGNDQDTMDKLSASGERTYERVWQLPMFDEYEKQNKSDIADVKNSGGRPAGTITAAFFLKQFIGKYKWVHLDIAGTAYLSESLEYVPRGASGVGVRLLADFLRHWNTKTSH